MTSHGLVYSFVVGGALIAVWLQHRGGSRMPQTGRRIVLHLLAALAAAILVPVLMRRAGTEDSPPAAMLMLFALVLPMFVYNFLTWIWLLKLLQRMLRIG
jgi:hypothetical protein